MGEKAMSQAPHRFPATPVPIGTRKTVDDVSEGTNSMILFLQVYRIRLAMPSEAQLKSRCSAIDGTHGEVYTYTIAGWVA